MILRKVGDKNLFCEKKDKSKKWYPATAEVITYVKANFKEGDVIITEFENRDGKGVIIKATKLNGNKGGKSGNIGGYKKNYGDYQEKMVERSVYASVATIVSGLKDVTVANVKTVIKDLYDQGITLVRGSSVSSAAKTEAPNTEEEPVDNTSEEPGASAEKEPDE